MNKIIYLSLILFFALASCCEQEQEKSDATAGFIIVDGEQFLLNGNPYYFSGTNYWYGMNLGAKESGDRERLIRELDHLKSLGITNLRVLAASEASEGAKYVIKPALQTAPGIYNEDVFGGLDFLLTEMAKRDMKAVMVMSNFWTWSGGFPQFLEWSGAGKIPYPQEEERSWDDFTDYSCEFYNSPEAMKMYEQTLETIINRKNHITGVLYKNDPTIMAWQLANEPRGYLYPEVYRDWIVASAAYIHSIDTNHLVTTGTEGNTSTTVAGTNVMLDNKSPDIDYITLHVWAQNWSWFDPNDPEGTFDSSFENAKEYIKFHQAAAKKLKKPMVMEEFGIARDGGTFDPAGTTKWRDKFYTYFYEVVKNDIQNNGPVKGINFWSYGGEGRPNTPGDYWVLGEDLIGDPSHELQGWYSVYDTDTSTLKIITDFYDDISSAK